MFRTLTGNTRHVSYKPFLRSVRVVLQVEVHYNSEYRDETVWEDASVGDLSQLCIVSHVAPNTLPDTNMPPTKPPLGSTVSLEPDKEYVNPLIRIQLQFDSVRCKYGVYEYNDERFNFGTYETDYIDPDSTIADMITMELSCAYLKSGKELLSYSILRVEVRELYIDAVHNTREYLLVDVVTTCTRHSFILIKDCMALKKVVARQYDRPVKDMLSTAKCLSNISVYDGGKKKSYDVYEYNDYENVLDQFKSYTYPPDSKMDVDISYAIKHSNNNGDVLNLLHDVIVGIKVEDIIMSGHLSKEFIRLTVAIANPDDSWKASHKQFLLIKTTIEDTLFSIPVDSLYITLDLPDSIQRFAVYDPPSIHDDENYTKVICRDVDEIYAVMVGVKKLDTYNNENGKFIFSQLYYVTVNDNPTCDIIYIVKGHLKTKYSDGMEVTNDVSITLVQSKIIK